MTRVDVIIRNYGSTFYIRICYGHFALFWPEISVSDFYQHHQIGEDVESYNDIRKKSRKACKTGVILVISIFTELPCSSSASSSSSSSPS